MRTLGGNCQSQKDSTEKGEEERGRLIARCGAGIFPNHWERQRLSVIFRKTSRDT